MNSRILRKFCTDIRARGIPTDAIEDQIRQTLGCKELVHGIHDSDLQLMTEKTDSEWINLRYRDKANMAKACGYIPIDEAISCLDRPYTFRNLLAPEISLLHGISVTPVEAYKTLPWKTRKRKFLEMIEETSSSLSQTTISERDKIIDLTVDSIHTCGRSIDIQKEVYFLPESVLLDTTMCTLRTPLH